MAKGIRKIFSEISNDYEFLNHLLTFNLDTLWRKKVINIALSTGGKLYLDACTGTGEIAIMLNKALRGKGIKIENSARIFAIDFSQPMLEVAKSKPDSAGIQFVNTECDTLPFPDNYFDCVIASFAARNLSISKHILSASIKEFHRVLKPNGTFLNLETSQPDSRIFILLFHFYLKFVVKPIGQLLSGARGAYSYLTQSIVRFYNREEFSNILLTNGFSSVETKKLFFGIAAIHIARK